MAKKAIVNIVYSPQEEKPHLKYSNEKGEVWHSNKRDPHKMNVGMGWYSIKNPRPTDSILVVEPFCVLEKDYSPSFVRNFKYIFTWANKAFRQPKLAAKTIEINHPTYHQHPNPDNFDKNWPKWSDRKNELVIVANNKSSEHCSELYSFRLLVADILEARSDIKISWYGHMPVKRKYYKGKLKDKHSRLMEVKFSLCTENSYDPMYTHNYFTEKMPDTWKAGAVPLYIGCHNIDSFGFPKSSYIDLRELAHKKGARWIVNKEALANRLKNYSEADYEKYRREVKSEIFQSGKFFERTAFSRAYDKIIDTFYRELNPNAPSQIERTQKAQRGDLKKKLGK